MGEKKLAFIISLASHFYSSKILFSWLKEIRNVACCGYELKMVRERTILIMFVEQLDARKYKSCVAVVASLISKIQLIHRANFDGKVVLYCSHFVKKKVNMI